MRASTLALMPRAALATVAVLLFACNFVSEGSRGSDDGSGSSSGEEATTMSTSSSSETNAGSATGEMSTGNSSMSSSSAGSTTTTSMTNSSSSATTGAACEGACDPADGDPYVGVGCTNDCELDFGGVTQWYCAGMCSPVGDPLGEVGCDEQDANMFCRLRTRSPAAKAVSWDVKPATDAPGFCCPNVGGIELGPWPDWGVEATICYQETSLFENHGAANVITGVRCFE